MHCPSCGFENPEGLKFCNECGTPLRMPCAQCGFTNQPQAKFCSECGAALLPQAGVSSAPPVAPRPHAPLSYTPTHLAEKILTSKAALEWERKQVTVLFADLKGSMELLADRDPEDARAILDPVLERMMEAMHRYEGTVNQVMGDGIMALFGAPLAHEDHAVRACYAALAMQAALRQYSDEVRRTHGLPVHFRVGLNSGEVVVRAIDNDLHMGYSAIGQTVHLAARMEQLAIPGSIVLTPATVRLVEGLVRLNTLGPVPVKGLAKAVEVFQLVGATAVRRRLQAGAARGLTRFVGRETEIAALAQALAWAGAGHGQVDQSRLAYVSSYRADYLRLSGSYDRALVAGQRALTLVVALGDIRLQAMTNEHLGVIYYSLGSCQRAMDCFRQSMASLESELLRERFGMAVPDAIESRTRLLLCLAEVGAFAEGVILGEEGIGLAEAINHPISLARACYGVGFVSLCKGDLHQAIARLERGLALCQTWSIRDWFLVLAAALGDAYALCGRLAEALPLLEQTVEQDAMRRRHLSSLWIAWLSEGYMLAGRLANAMPLARQALDLARDGRERGCEAWALRVLGEIHSHQDSLDTDQAAAHYRQALALAEALGRRPLQAHCHRGLGPLYTKIDQREQARAELSAAIALYRPMDMSFWLPQGEAALAQMEGR